jgi:hypothetical protein
VHHAGLQVDLRALEAPHLAGAHRRFDPQEEARGHFASGRARGEFGGHGEYLGLRHPAAARRRRCGLVDVAHGIQGEPLPFLAGHLEHRIDEVHLPPHSRARNGQEASIAPGGYVGSSERGERLAGHWCKPQGVGCEPDALPSAAALLR